MRIIDCLVCEDPVKVILEEAGQFMYCDSSGEETHATFFVRCQPKPAIEEESEYDSVNAARQDALNTQLTEIFYKLESQGCSNIHFKNKLPDPFF